MLRATNKIWPIRLVLMGIATALLLSTSALATQQRPKELRGEVTGVTGDRIYISLSQKEWLPLAGMAVELGAEMAGMFVPLKGKFVIIQVNADSCIAKAVCKEEHGKPAHGMAAVIKTLFPKPQSRNDYVKAEKDPRIKNILQAAEDGYRPAMAMRTLASIYEHKGDHDAALIWWERASNGANGAKERHIISESAVGRAKILFLRSEFQKALAILQDAASRTKPPADEMVFKACAGPFSGVKFHVRVLEELGRIYRNHFDNIGESHRWFREAAKVMEACATNGAPEPGQSGYNTDYQYLLRDLTRIYLDSLEDEEAAVPWLQSSARAGDKYAQKKLTDMGRTW